MTWLPDGRLVSAAGTYQPPGKPGETCVRYENRVLLSVWRARRARPTQLDLPGCAEAQLVPWGSDVAVLCPWGALFRLDTASGRFEPIEGVRPRALWSSPDGQTLIVASGEGYEIWRGEGVARGQRYLSAAAALGSHVALGGERFIEVRGPSQHAIMQADSWVKGLAWRPDGKALAACIGRRVGWWDAETGEALTPFVGHTESVTAVALSSDGRRAVSGSRAGDVIIWDTQSGSVLTRFLFPEVVAVDEVAWDEGIVTARAGEDWQRFVVDPDWAPGPPRSYRIEGQQDGTVLLFETQ